MSLQKFMKEKAQQELAEVQKKLDLELTKAEAHAKEMVKDAEKKFKTSVTDEIQRGVARARFEHVKSKKFKQGWDRAKEAEKLYEAVLGGLLADPAFVEKLLKKPLAALKQGEKVQVHVWGKSAKAFETAVKKHGISEIKTTPSENWGGVRFEGQDTDIVVDADDLVKSAEKKSLREVYTLLS